MARIHARKKGKSGSKRPVNADLSFVSLKKNEIEKLVVKLAKEDKKPSQIGLILRDTYGIPSVKLTTGKSITKILEENKLLSNIPEDLESIISKIKSLKKHLETHTRDTHNKRSLILLESKCRRLIKYYKRVGRIDSNFKY